MPKKNNPELANKLSGSTQRSENQEIEGKGPGLEKDKTPSKISLPVKEKNEEPAAKKIIIVDDHPIVRQGISLLVQSDKSFVFAGEAEDSTAAMNLLKKVNPDLIIIDISLKGTSGLDLIKNILLYKPEALILVVSSHEDSFYVDRALKAGAKGYLVKYEATDSIIQAIHKIFAGEIYVSEKMKDVIVSRFINGTNGNENNSFYSLSDRELEVLRLIGQGLTTRQIAEKLFVSTKTIDSHYANIKNKLNLNNSHELIQYSVKWVLRENA